MILKRKYEKRDAVSYILLISKIQILAASYYNGLIVLWDTLLMEQRKIYKDHKTVNKIKIYNYIFTNCLIIFTERNFISILVSFISTFPTISFNLNLFILKDLL